MLPGLTALSLLAGWATGDPRVAQGREVYAVACAACHGAGGRGNPAWESARRPPDLADCGATAERSDHWQAIVARGGGAFGLSSTMPAYGETLTRDEIGAAVAYVRTLCASADRYPPGELNPRRLLATKKAYPETEVSLAASYALDEKNDMLLKLGFENRLGRRFQYGFGAPVRPWFAENGRFAGLGNVELEIQGVLAHSPRRGTIAALGLEAEAPTGAMLKDLGEGSWIFKPYAAFAWTRGNAALQTHTLLALPAKLDREDRRLEYAVGSSRSFGLSRTGWTPALEVAGVFNLRRHDWRHAALVELSHPLNRLGHVVGSVGVRVPLGRSLLPTRLEGHLLWDFGEGSFRRGW